jgi:hypothetical protein
VTPAFVPAVELSAAFYREAVKPLLGGRAHAAALLGWGSDVLGYDTERSTDHGWGPRLLVFLRDGDDVEWTARLDERLPQQFRGWPVRYGWDATPTQHWVTVTTLAQWCQDHLGVDATTGTDEPRLADDPAATAARRRRRRGARRRRPGPDEAARRPRLVPGPGLVLAPGLPVGTRGPGGGLRRAHRRGRRRGRLRDHGGPPGAGDHAPGTAAAEAVRPVLEVARHGVRAADPRGRPTSPAARCGARPGLRAPSGRPGCGLPVHR